MCGEDTLLQPRVKESNYFTIFYLQETTRNLKNMKVPLSREGYFFLLFNNLTFIQKSQL